jgi:hypothetical protein
MYAWTVFLHTVVRWLAIAAGIAAVYRAVKGRSSQRPWTFTDSCAVAAFTASLNLQFLIGAVLFLRSPITILGTHELALASQSSILSFYTVVHPVVMTTAILVANAACVRIWRQGNSSVRYRLASMFFGLALLLILAGTPWPSLPYGRPLLSMLQ